MSSVFFSKQRQRVIATHRCHPERSEESGVPFRMTMTLTCQQTALYCAVHAAHEFGGIFKWLSLHNPRLIKQQ